MKIIKCSVTEQMNPLSTEIIFLLPTWVMKPLKTTNQPQRAPRTHRLLNGCDVSKEPWRGKYVTNVISVTSAKQQFIR